MLRFPSFIVAKVAQAFLSSQYSGQSHEKKGPADYFSKDSADVAKKGMGGKMTNLSDAGDDDEEEEGDEDEDLSSVEAMERRGSIRSNASNSTGSRRVSFSQFVVALLLTHLQKSMNQAKPNLYDHSPPLPNRGISNGLPSNLHQQPFHLAAYPGQQSYSNPFPAQGQTNLNGYAGPYYSNNGTLLPPHSQQQQQQPQQNWYAPVLPPIANSVARPHPLAGIAPQPSSNPQQSWGYPAPIAAPSQSSWGIPPNGYGGGPSAYGQQTPYGGPGGMHGGPDLAALQTSYSMNNHDPGQRTARPEGCFSQESSRMDEGPAGEPSTPFEGQYSNQYNSASSIASTSTARPQPPSRSSTANSSYSSDKPRLSVNIPAGERIGGMVLREDKDGKVYTEASEREPSEQHGEQDDEERGLVSRIFVIVAE